MYDLLVKECMMIAYCHKTFAGNIILKFCDDMIYDNSIFSLVPLVSHKVAAISLVKIVK